MKTLHYCALLASLYVALALNACNSASTRVEIKEKDGAYQLYRGGEPYFIKGAVGWDYLDRLAAWGEIRFAPVRGTLTWQIPWD